MKLTLDGIRKDRAAFEAAGYLLPVFSYDAVKENTLKRPVWIHFGAGNIFRAFPANVVQKLLNEGLMDTGLIAAEGYDYEIIEKSSRPHDNLTILAILKSDRQVEKAVVASILESYILDSQSHRDFSRLKEIFVSPSLQIASFTITEKGYSLTDETGGILPSVEAGYAAGPAKPESYLGKVTSLLYARYQKGKLPIAMASMDNCSHNGHRLYESVSSFAEEWCKRGLAEPGFAAYVSDKNTVSFPWSMIDKITPRPDERVKAMLEKDGLEALDAVITSKNTYIAPFVNAEECEYLVIEDAFPNGRPPLEKGGILFASKNTVEQAEKMKVCTCLNPLHTTLAIFGCLLGYTLISEEMKNPLLKKLVELIGYKEGLPVVTNPGVIDPVDFLDRVINLRFPNPFLPDTPKRIAADTSQKLAIRFGETIKAYEKSVHLDAGQLKLIPLVFAGWLRYLMAVDDEGRPFTPSPDPLLDSLTPHLAGFSLDNAAKDLTQLDRLLENRQIFGVNLHKVKSGEGSMADLVKSYFVQLSDGIGAVAATLQKYVK